MSSFAVFPPHHSPSRVSQCCCFRFVNYGFPMLISRPIIAFIPPSHRRRGATAVLVRHKPQWRRRDSSGSVHRSMVPSVIAVTPRKTVNTADLRGGTAETLNMFKISAGHRGLGQSAVGSPRHRHDRRGTVMTAVVPYKNRSSTSITAVPPQYNRRAIAKKVEWRPYGYPVAVLLRSMCDR